MNLEKMREQAISLGRSLTSSLHSLEGRWPLAIVVLASIFLFLNCPRAEQPARQCPDNSVYKQCDEALVSCGEYLESCHADNIRMHDEAARAVRELKEKNDLLEKKEEQNKKDSLNARNRKKVEDQRIEAAEPRELSNVLSKKYN